MGLEIENYVPVLLPYDNSDRGDDRRKGTFSFDSKPLTSSETSRVVLFYQESRLDDDLKGRNRMIKILRMSECGS